MQTPILYGSISEILYEKLSCKFSHVAINLIFMLFFQSIYGKFVYYWNMKIIYDALRSLSSKKCPTGGIYGIE